MESSFAHQARVIESILEGYGRGDVSAMLEHVTDDVEWRPLMTAAEGRAFRGPEGVQRWYSELMESFDEVTPSVEGHRPIGDRVLTSGHLVARGRTSGVLVDQTVTWLWDFRGEAVRRMETFSDHDEALAAAGEPL
jgi:ketosteroid isomerase-like protein